MQSIDVNFYTNSVEVRVNPDPTITVRARIVFQRTVKLYRGVDNVIQLQFKNSDQKPVNVTGWVITFNMISANDGTLVVTKNSNNKMTGNILSGTFNTGEQILQSNISANTSAGAYFVSSLSEPLTTLMFVEGVITGTPTTTDLWTGNVSGAVFSPNTLPVSDGISILDAVNGLASVKLSSYDIHSLRHEFYNYGITVTDPATGSEQVVYADDNYWARGELQLVEGPYPKYKPSVDVLIPFNSNAFIISSWVPSDAPAHQQTAYHTAQFYFENYTGNIQVQTTLDSLPPVGNGFLSWNTVTTLNYVNQTTPDYYDFAGISTAVRFVCWPADPTQSYMTGANVLPKADSVTKILYRG